MIRFLLLIALTPMIALAALQSRLQVISAGSMTGTSVINGTAVDIGLLQHVSFQSLWTAGSTPVGVLKLQGSDDLVKDCSTVTNWTDVPAAAYSGTTAVSGNAGASLLTASNLGVKCLRLVYTNTSGTGTLNATYFGKGPQ